MTLEHPPVIHDAVISSLVGSSFLSRGRTYSRKGAVFGVEWNPKSLELKGKVQGTRNNPYKAKASFKDGISGLRLDWGHCSCPVQFNCKHVAALLLEISCGPVMEQPPLLEVTPAAAPPAPKKKAAPAPPKAAGQQVRKDASPAPWQEQIQSLLHPEATPRHAGVSGGKGRSTAALGVQLELSESSSGQSPWYQRGRSDPWQGNSAPQVTLTARPVKQNAKGTWVVGQLRWDTFRRSNYGYQLDEFSTGQVRWMQAFDALFAAGASQPPGTHLPLERFDNPLLWELLAQAGQVGVALLMAKSGDAVVVIHDPVDLSLDLRDHDGGLRLAPHVGSGDFATPAETAAVGAIGTPGHGVFWWDAATGPGTSSAARDLHLAPTTATVPAAIRTLIRHRTELLVPADARDSFLADSFPQLAQSARITCSDSSVDLPEILPPELVLTAAHTSRELQLGWHWEYHASGTVTRLPLTPFGEGYRDHAFEERLLAQVAASLEQFPVAWQEQFPDNGSGQPGSTVPSILKNLSAARFTTEALPRLKQLEHVRVVTTGPAPDYSELTDSPLIGVRTQETDDADWFDLGVTVTLGGEDVPFDLLFRALAAGDDHLMLANGNYFRLDQPEFLQLRRLIEEARALQENEGPLRISLYQAGLWGELEELSANAEQAESWRRSVGGLLGFSEIQDVPPPAGLDASLRPYQQEGFNWLAFLWEHGLGGVLADDMGLGKTLQAIALILHAKNGIGVPDRDKTACHPFLVVAPTSVVPNWAAETGRFAPGLRTTAVTDTLQRSGTDPAALAAGSDVVVVSYTLFRLDYEAYASSQWAGLVLDEAQFVKNPATKASQNARRFPATFKLAITGTPMENNLMELWSMFAITAPGLFPSSKNFTDYYRTPVEKDGDAAKLAQLRRRIRPLMMRRNKELVAKDLPAKQEQVLELDLAPRHRTIYQRHLQRERQKVLGLLDDMEKNRFAIFKSLTTLRRLSLDASLVDEKHASVPSSKLDALLEQLGDIVAEGHRALIFSQFTGFLAKAADRLDAEGIPYAYLDGKTRRRAAVLEQFKAGSAPVFLISLKAGGFGLNLTEADYVFLLDPWWNPASEAQAVDRTHRIGQTRNVMVYRLVAKDTIEEKVMALKEKKAKLFSAVLDDDAMFASALSADDVRDLFEG
ncbi:DEAD/DEAH box helicase [Pseudarthrobacter sp. R1]|uniref:DEAD/DEAH box helicase n=1 Tax=Pseudarthrobacter sp. R1 TaxID=2944934 RepID=UPI00210934A3|nr:DEAD/DEAH box helicase [Pseudarthrobacter sp. R1]MCQ6269089.1 DEAD/DEAH box helicase [Pseudarthrobacter sp. R1]